MRTGTHRGISIHSLRMEGDTVGISLTQKLCNFNPLPPHGGRQLHYLSPRVRISFQSTPSAWRETVALVVVLPMVCAFQSTPSAWRETTFFSLHTYCNFHFNPLPPHGGRQLHSGTLFPLVAFQSTPSAWRETDLFNSCLCCIHISIHSLRMEGDTPIYKYKLVQALISIHSLRMEGDNPKS